MFKPKTNYKFEKHSSHTDPELVSKIARELDTSTFKAKEILTIVVECIRGCLDTNGFVNIRRLGRFNIRQRKRMRMKNFSGVMIEIPLIYELRFSSSSSLRSFINKKVLKDKNAKLNSRHFTL